jgi:hypothetical protein
VSARGGDARLVRVSRLLGTEDAAAQAATAKVGGWREFLRSLRAGCATEAPTVPTP